MSFLKAHWTNLALINYEVDPGLLENHLPKGTEIDLWNGKCYISLVGFMFEDVKLIGVRVPFHINFEEVNLRFYVKRSENGNWKRGVVFIKEIVPKPALAIVANLIYKENYQTLPMRHAVIETEHLKKFCYQWKYKGKWNIIEVETEKNLVEISENSEAEFITEHYFGYTKVSKNTTFEYEVRHPKWEQFQTINHNIDIDFEANYGSRFAFLQQQKPCSVFLAKGSKITVENKKKLQ